MVPPDATEVIPYMTSAAVIVYAQRWLKSSRVYAAVLRLYRPDAAKWVHRAVAGLDRKSVV